MKDHMHIYGSSETHPPASPRKEFCSVSYSGSQARLPGAQGASGLCLPCFSGPGFLENTEGGVFLNRRKYPVKCHGRHPTGNFQKIDERFH